LLLLYEDLANRLVPMQTNGTGAARRPVGHPHGTKGCPGPGSSMPKSRWQRTRLEGGRGLDERLWPATNRAPAGGEGGAGQPGRGISFNGLYPFNGLY
jgi:hypothetical protein